MPSASWLAAVIDPVRLGGALTYFVWQGLVIGLVLEVALAVAGIRNAALRYALCGLALAAMPLCLLNTYSTLGHEPALSPTCLSTDPGVLSGIAPDASPNDLTLRIDVPGLTRLTVGNLPALSVAPWLPVITRCWLACVVILALRKAGGLVVLWRLRNRHVFHPGEILLTLCGKACARIGVDPRSIYLGVSERVRVPMTMGWLRPVVLFPASLASGLSADEIELLLAHELAHIRRYDYLANLAQTIIETLFFYHPVVWWISRRMRQERENSCDDLVAAGAPDTLAYARVLFRLESFRPPGGSLAASAAGGNLLQRVRRLVNNPAPPSTLGGSASLVMLAVLTMLAFGSLVKARTVSGDESSPGRTGSTPQKIPSAPGTSDTRASADSTASSTKPSRALSSSPPAIADPTVLYRDDFSRAGELDGAPPAVSATAKATWTSSTGSGQYLSDNHRALVSPSAYGYSLAYLPVNGASGVALDGTRNFTLSAVITSGSTGRVGISLNKGEMIRYSNLYTNNFATLSTCSGFAGAYAFNEGTINYNYAPGINGPTRVAITYDASAKTVTYRVGSTVVATQTGVAPAMVSDVRWVAIGNDGYGDNAPSPAPSFTNFTLAVGGPSDATSTSPVGSAAQKSISTASL